MVLNSHRNRQPRLLFMMGILGLLLAVLVSGLAWRQFVDRQRLKELEVVQAQRRILQPGPRGVIFDRNGKLLVGNRPRFSAVIYPDGIQRLRPEIRREYARRLKAFREAREAGADIEFDYNEMVWASRQAVVERYMAKINAITGREAELQRRDLRNHFSRELLMPFTLVRDLTPAEYAALIEQLPVNSPVQIFTDSARFYPYGTAAAHTLGYVVTTLLKTEHNEQDLPGEELMTFEFQGQIGRTGLERAFDEKLRGRTGVSIHRVDPLGYQYDTLEEPRVSVSQGEAVYTSLDIRLQQAAEEGLGERTGAAVAVDVESGEILALASKPSYDLNRLSPFIPTEVWEEIRERGALLNRATQGLYPPGSTFKIITAIAAMQEEVIDPDTRVQTGPFTQVGNRRFPEHNRRGFGKIDVRRALAVSSNTFFYQVGVATSIDNIAPLARAFGLEDQVDIELPFTARRMIVPDKAWKREDGRGGWVPGDTANTAIGQGFLLTTPLHMGLFTASLGRGETRTNATLLRRTKNDAAVDHGGRKIDLTPAELEAIYAGMRLAVTDGTARLAAIEEAKVGGKTGTAQVRAQGEDLTLAWFVGLAPINDPKIAVCVMVEGTVPGDNYHGGSTAAPVARKIFRQYFEDRPFEGDGAKREAVARR